MAAPSADPFRVIKGEMAARVRAFDWTKTPLGPIAGWPQSLKTAVGMVLLSPVPIVMLWGEDGIMIYNDGYSEFAGQRHPSLLGSKVREGWPEVADFNDNIMKVGLAGGTLAYRDFVLDLNRTGTFEPVWLDLDYSPILDDDGKPAGVMAIVVEITKRVQAEKKVRADHERMAQMFAQAPSFMAQLDGPEHVYTLTNRAYQKLVGGRDVIGKTIRDALPELEGQGFFELLDQVYRNGEPYVGRAAPVTLQAAPGAPREHVLLDFLYQPIKAADGSVTGIFVEGVDVTEAHAAERALVESEQRFHDIADATPVLIWISDTTKACTWFNKTWLDFTGRTMEQEYGNGWAEGVHPDDYARCLDTYVTAFDKREPFRMYYRLRRHDGEWRTIDDNGVPRFAADGTFMGYIGSCIDVTDERAAEDAMRRSEERLRLATENAGVGLWDIDPEGGIDFSYSRRSSSFVMDRENRVPMTHLLSRLHPDDAPLLEASYDAARDPARRAMLDVEYRVLPEGDSPLRWIKIRGRGAFDGEGNLLRISGTALDVTHERETQHALSQSEELLRLATDNAEIGLWDMDVVANENHPHPRVKAMFGLPADRNMPAEDFFKLIHKDDIARVTAAYAEAFDPVKRAFYDVEYRVNALDGVQRWIQARGRGIFDENGTCLRVTGTAVDITAERQTQEALRRSEELLRLATGHAEIGLWDVDNVANTLTWTKPVRAAFGITHDGAVSLEDFYSGLHPDDLAMTSEAFSAAMDPKTRSLYDVEYRTIGQEDDVERWIHAKGRGLFDDEGRCLRVVGTTIDVTARKRIEAELHELNETLEKRVAERTAALEKTQAALQQAQKMEAIGNLTGGIAHDFNNLLQGLTGSLDLIRNKPQDTERVRRWAEAGLQAAERGAKLTAQLLAFSRAQKLEVKPLNLNTLLEEMRDLLGRTLGPSTRVTMDLAPDAGAVLGDQTQLEMAVLNLAINARDAMPDGGVLTLVTRPLAIASDLELQAGDYVELRVSDTGAGMSDEVIARAFDPFFTTKGVGKGTGLGLSQVYGMAQQAGGVARIGSEPGLGTTISIILRATDAAGDGEAKDKQREFTTADRSATVLVIDDDPDVRAFLAESLDAFGYAVLEAGDGLSGLELLAQRKPDLLLVDYAMPGMTGAEVAARVRKIHTDMPIIFASGYAETAALENVQDVHTAILRKPFRLGELQEAVANLLPR